MVNKSASVDFFMSPGWEEACSTIDEVEGVGLIMIYDDHLGNESARNWGQSMRGDSQGRALACRCISSRLVSSFRGLER